MQRITYIDNIRGIAFILMVIQHIFYFYDVSMNYETNISKNILVDTSGTIARTLFILLAGLSIGLSNTKVEGKKNKLKNRIKRSLEIGLHGLLITLVSYIIYPDVFVRFGILQFIAVGTFIMGMVAQYKNMSFVVIIICLLMERLTTTNNNILDLMLGLNNRYSMMDYFPLLKWLPVMAVGVILGQNIKLNDNTNIKLLDNTNHLTNLGKNSLNLYTIHIIVLMLYFSYINKIR